MQSPPARPLGIFTWFGYPLPIADRARLIREAGFTTVMHWWDDTHNPPNENKQTQTTILRQANLQIENAHLTDAQSNDLWLDTLAGEAAQVRYLSDLDTLSACNIPVAVLHPSSGRTPPPITPTGLHRLRTLSEHAHALGLRIAIENVRHPERCATILDAIDTPSLGLCYDAGHDHVWPAAPLNLLARYGHRLYAIHLHDNHGDADAHLPLGDGSIDWARVRQAIEASAYRGSYTIEGDTAAIAAGTSPQAHLRRHFEGARKMLGERA